MKSISDQLIWKTIITWMRARARVCETPLWARVYNEIEIQSAKPKVQQTFSCSEIIDSTCTEHGDTNKCVPFPFFLDFSLSSHIHGNIFDGY